jgi:hypothetical protein
MANSRPAMINKPIHFLVNIFISFFMCLPDGLWCITSQSPGSFHSLTSLHRGIARNLSFNFGCSRHGAAVCSLAWVTFLNSFGKFPIQVPGGINPAGRRFFQKSFAPGDFIQFFSEFIRVFAGRGLNWEKSFNCFSAPAGFKRFGVIPFHAPNNALARREGEYVNSRTSNRSIFGER